MTNKHVSLRLDGLDLARFFAFVGMVIVNFKIAMGAGNDNSLLSLITVMLEGKAAATFVVLAGIGLGLAAKRSEHTQTVSVTFKRAGFLLVLGLVNSLIFDADILHYYAFYFLFGVLVLPLKSRWLVICIVLLNLAFLVMLFIFDYDAGWNWDTYTYSDFWTSAGFVRNLFFNGWHPVVPWLGFLLFGIILSRVPLSKKRVQHALILFGIALYVLAELTSTLLSGPLSSIGPKISALVTTEPVPPAPLYVLAGIGCASLVTGLCLRFSDWFDRIGLLKFLTPAGKQTLTLYIAHILIGMGTLEALGLLGEQTLVTAVLSALLFCLVAMVYAFVWEKLFKRGPTEAMMRRIAG